MKDKFNPLFETYTFKTNKRTDEWGGSLEKRMRLPFCVRPIWLWRLTTATWPISWSSDWVCSSIQTLWS